MPENPYILVSFRFSDIPLYWFILSFPAIRQIINQAVESTAVVDIFDAAGIKKPDISLLSEEFLQEVKELKHKNLGIELLKKILNDEIKVRLKFNITEGKNLLDMLEASIKKYQNNLLSTAEIIEELLAIARQIRTVDGLAEESKLTKDEFAFYTALEVNDCAVKVLGNETLKNIAREIADKVRKNATIDWAMKESARAKLMVIAKRTLNKYGYPRQTAKSYSYSVETDRGAGGLLGGILKRGHFRLRLKAGLRKPS